MSRSTAAVWTYPTDQTSRVIVAADSEDGTPSVGPSLIRLVVDRAGNPRLALVWKNDHGGTSPLIANGVLVQAGTGSILALDALTGQKLWSGTGEFIVAIWHDTAERETRSFVPNDRANLFAYGADAVDTQRQVERDWPPTPTRIVPPSNSEFDFGAKSSPESWPK